MASYVAGEVAGVTKWHEVDEAGPDVKFLEIAQGAGIWKTKCGMHYGCDPTPATTAAFPVCGDC